jgi:hypothetical protein
LGGTGGAVYDVEKIIQALEKAKSNKALINAEKTDNFLLP